MLKNRTFAEVMVLLTGACTVFIPAALWTYFTIKEGKMQEFPLTLTAFIGAANAIICALLGLQQFAAKSKATP